MIGPRTGRKRVGDAAHEQRRHQARVEAARPDDHGIEAADRLGHRRVNHGRRLEPHALDATSLDLRGIHFHFTAA